MINENGDDLVGSHVTAGTTSSDVADGYGRNNYSRPSNQQVGRCAGGARGAARLRR